MEKEVDLSDFMRDNDSEWDSNDDDSVSREN